MMFGRIPKDTVASALKELYKARIDIEDKIEAERADLIRAQVNVLHHMAQAEFLNKRRAFIDAAITKTEREEDERKEAKGVTQGTARAWGSGWRRKARPDAGIPDGATA